MQIIPEYLSTSELLNFVMKLLLSPPKAYSAVLQLNMRVIPNFLSNLIWMVNPKAIFRKAAPQNRTGRQPHKDVLMPCEAERRKHGLTGVNEKSV
jgi:hypothetical protein